MLTGWTSSFNALKSGRYCIVKVPLQDFFGKFSIISCKVEEKNVIVIKIKNLNDNRINDEPFEAVRCTTFNKTREKIHGDF
jgi:hypothetical protein